MRKKRIEHINQPKGIKISECVNCLWNSRNNRGSSEDLIKISKSGNIPEKKPKMPAKRTNFFFEKDWGSATPSKPWDKGSIFYSP